MTFLIPLLVSAGLVPDIAPPAGDCHQLDSDAVLARDLAPLVPGFAKLPEDFLIGYVESSGAPRIFHGLDLEHIARNRGVILQGLEDLCLERRTFVATPARIAEAMRKTLGDLPGLKIEILSSTQQPVPTGEIVFQRSGVQPPAGPEVTWRGSVQAGKGTSYPVWARARITVTANRVIAAVDLSPGTPIQPSHIRVESAEESPFEDGLVRTSDDTVGLVAKATIQKGSAIRKTQVAPPLDVARGDLVRLEVYTGNAHLSMEVRAETSGMKGSTITVRNLSSGRDFQARVAGKGQVTVGGLAE
jgi:flagella basal body P-ring formation protein FlgA